MKPPHKDVILFFMILFALRLLFNREMLPCATRCGDRCGQTPGNASFHVQKRRKRVVFGGDFHVNSEDLELGPNKMQPRFTSMAATGAHPPPRREKAAALSQPAPPNQLKPPSARAPQSGRFPSVNHALVPTAKYGGGSGGVESRRRRRRTLCLPAADNEAILRWRLTASRLAAALL